ncbi:MAG: DMT family transporter [Candidatus Latescibacterota bacterium]|nr:MAG: DMT family transporter [Candidatus Latescibacterota bacterium]
MRKQTGAYLFALAAVLCWSTVASAFKLTLRTTAPETMLLWASLFSAAFLFGVRFAVRKPGAPAGRLPSPAELRRSAAAGFLNPFLYYTVLFRAYDLLPAQEAQPLNYTWPIVVVLLSAPMLGQRIRPLGLVAVLVSFAGVIVVSTRGDVLGMRFANGPGALLAVGSSAIWAFYWIRNLQDPRDGAEKLAWGFLFGAAYALLFHLLLGRDPRISSEGLLGSLYIGLFEMGLAFLLWLRALTQSETSAKVSNLVFLSPFLSLFFIRFVVGEKILPSSVIGLAVIVLGIWIQKKA